MPQSLIQLPKTADFKMGNRNVKIQKHQVLNEEGLFVILRSAIRTAPYNRQLLHKFEDHRISFEAAIEYCIRELEEKPGVLADVIYWYYFDLWNGRDVRENELEDYSKSITGRKIADEFIEKIRNCSSWEELYDEMRRESEFNKHMSWKSLREFELNWNKAGYEDA